MSSMDKDFNLVHQNALLDLREFEFKIKEQNLQEVAQSDLTIDYASGNVSSQL